MRNITFHQEVFIEFCVGHPDEYVDHTISFEGKNMSNDCFFRKNLFYQMIVLLLQGVDQIL